MLDDLGIQKQLEHYIQVRNPQAYLNQETEKPMSDKEQRRLNRSLQDNLRKGSTKVERFFALVVHKAIQGFMHKLFKGTTRSIRKEIPQCNSFRLMEQLGIDSVNNNTASQGKLRKLGYKAFHVNQQLLNTDFQTT